MSEENIKKLLEAMQNDSNALELLKGFDAPQDQDGEIKAYAEVAQKLGYDISEADLKTYLDRAENRMQQKTEEASSIIQELPDEALERVAGGKKDHSECKDTYRDYENCWVNDGCDVVYHHYKNYVCHKNDWDDPCHATAKPCDKDAYCFYNPNYI